MKIKPEYFAFGFQLGLKYYFEFLTLNHKNHFAAKNHGLWSKPVLLKRFNSNPPFFHYRHVVLAPSLIKQTQDGKYKNFI